MRRKIELAQPAVNQRHRVTMKVLPLVYMGNLTDEDLAKYNCSDRIWVCRDEFEKWMRDAEPGITICLKLRNAVDQTVPVSIFGVHHDDSDHIYVPAWMLDELEHDHDNVYIDAFEDVSMCMGITIAPHTSDHLSASDPQELLRDGFENYTFLIPGLDYKIWLGDHDFTVSLVSVKPDKPVVCIRNCELTLELLPPLDLPIPPPPAPTTTPTAIESPSNTIAYKPVHEIIKEQIESGLRPSNEVLREKMRDAALKRLAENKKEE